MGIIRLLEVIFGGAEVVVPRKGAEKQPFSQQVNVVSKVVLFLVVVVMVGFLLAAQFSGNR